MAEPLSREPEGSAAPREIKDGHRLIWWGFKGITKRPCWYGRSQWGDLIIREIGVGPIGYAFIKRGGG